MRSWPSITASCAALALACPTAAYSQSSHDKGEGTLQTGGVSDIIVTAQKRSETANKVGMSITALSGEALVQQGISSPNDLVRVVPGFNATEAPRGTPIYAIRGIGFDDSTLGSNSTVAVYVDEVPLSFAPEARFVTLDLERVEVLKGPQGILFGQNSTAGAINFIAAKPTDEFTGGFDGSFSRFNRVDVRGFLSGALTDELKVRVSAMGVHSNGWQKSYTRDDRLGAARQFAARFIAEWNPVADLKLTLNINGWSDKSDTQAGQLLESFPLLPAAAVPEYDAYPRAPRNARAADWDVNAQEGRFRRNDNFLQASVRADYEISKDLTFTSITAWSRYNQDFLQDTDGSSIPNFTFTNIGWARSFNQEIRLAGDHGSLKWIVGGNYSRDKTFDSTYFYYPVSSPHFGFLGLVDAYTFGIQPIRTMAAFGNADYAFNDVVTIHAGVRYSKDKRQFSGCTADAGRDISVSANAYNIVLGLVGTPNEIQPGGCTTSHNGIPGIVQNSMNQDNVSWRLGVDFQLDPTFLAYANVSKGYKSGSFPAVNTSADRQLDGVTQESVLAYEAGIKAGLFGRKVQLNAAGFYYDYRDKQLRGRILDPFGVFGVIDALINIPKSRVYGAEASVQIAPVRGLNFNIAGTYVNSKVTKNPPEGYDPVGNILEYKGLSFPHTPKWNLTASADYEFPVSSTTGAFVGTNLTYQSETTGLFNRPELIGTTQVSPVLRPGVFLDPDTFKVKGYTTVDVRLGIQELNGRWKAWIWGRNIFNTYYWSNVTQSLDSIYRLAGMPATYGVSVSLRM